MKDITTVELKELIDKGEDFVLLDCRSRQRYNTEHLPGAINLPVDTITKEEVSKILPDKSTLLVTSCGGITCSTSIKCYEKLKSLSYTNVVEYYGGLAEWKAHGFETIK